MGIGVEKVKGWASLMRIKTAFACYCYSRCFLYLSYPVSTWQQHVLYVPGCHCFAWEGA